MQISASLLAFCLVVSSAAAAPIFQTENDALEARAFDIDIEDYDIYARGLEADDDFEEEEFYARAHGDAVKHNGPALNHAFHESADRHDAHGKQATKDARSKAMGEVLSNPSLGSRHVTGAGKAAGKPFHDAAKGMRRFGDGMKRRDYDDWEEMLYARAHGDAVKHNGPALNHAFHESADRHDAHGKQATKDARSKAMGEVLSNPSLGSRHVTGAGKAAGKPFHDAAKGMRRFGDGMKRRDYDDWEEMLFARAHGDAVKHNGPALNHAFHESADRHDAHGKQATKDARSKAMGELLNNPSLGSRHVTGAGKAAGKPFHDAAKGMRRFGDGMKRRDFDDLIEELYARAHGDAVRNNGPALNHAFHESADRHDAHGKQATADARKKAMGEVLSNPSLGSRHVTSAGTAAGKPFHDAAKGMRRFGNGM